MSYASVAAHNAPPPSEQPHADPALLTTDEHIPQFIPNDNAKVKVVPHSDFPSSNTHNSSSNEGPKQPSNKHARDAEDEGFRLWELTKHYVFRPGVAGGLVGLSM